MKLGLGIILESCRFRSLGGIILLLICSVVWSSCKFDKKSEKSNGNEPSGTIAFTSNRDGNKEIYLMDSKGNILRNITNYPAMEYGASWSPDGRYIATYSNRNFNQEIYLIDLEIKEDKRITENPAEDVLPEISPDGKHIVFASDRNGKSRSVFKMNIDGGNPVALTNNDDYEESPSWSPDGRYILFTRQLRQVGDTTYAANGEIFRMRSDGSEVERVTDKTGYDSGAVYSPDGKQIAFYGPDKDTFEIFLMNADGSGIQNITRDSLDCYSPSWSPDGKWIAYTAGKGENYDIYILNTESGEKRRLTDTKVRNESPAWAPDPEKK